MTQQILQIISGLLSTNNQERLDAEVQLYNMLQSPEGQLALIDLLKSKDESQQRMAATIIKQNVKDFVQKLDSNQLQYVKGELMRVVPQVALTSTQNILADAVAIFVSQPDFTWPELLQFIHTLYDADNEQSKVIALKLFTSLCEFVGEQMQNILPNLKNIIHTAIVAGTPALYTQAVDLFVRAAMLVDTSDLLASYREELPLVIQVCEQLIQAGEHDKAQTLLDSITDLLEDTPKMFNNILPLVTQHAAAIATNTDLQSNKLRETAAEFLKALARKKPSSLVKQNLLEPVLSVACALAVEPAPPHLDTSIESAVHTVGASLAEELSLHVASKQVYPLVKQWVTQYAATSALHARAGLLLLGAISEGCYKSMSRDLDTWLPSTLASLQSDQQIVREAAASALHHFTLYLNPHIQSAVDTVIPALFGAVQDPHPPVRTHACVSIGTYCESLSPADVVPYLPRLMERLEPLLSVPTATSCSDEQLEVLEAAISALCGIATVTGEAFKEYALQIIPLLTHLVQQEQSSYLNVRTRATDCITYIVESLGGSVLEQHGRAVVEAAVRGLTVSYLDLKVSTYQLFVQLSSVMGTSFTPCLQYILPHALESVNADDGGTRHAESADHSDGTNHEEVEGGKHKYGGDTSAASGRQIGGVRTGAVEEKSYALECIGSASVAVGAEFSPWLAQCGVCGYNLIQHTHAKVRAAAAKCLGQLLVAANVVHGASFTGGVQSGVSGEVQGMWRQVEESWLQRIAHDDNKAVVISCLRGIEISLAGINAKHWGASTWMETSMQRLMQACMSVLNGDVACAASPPPGDDESDDEETQSADMFDAITNLMPYIIHILTPAHFIATHAQQYTQHLLARCGEDMPDELRGISMGALGEMLRDTGTPGACMLVTSDVVDGIVRECQSGVDDNMQNAAYMVRQMYEHARDDDCVKFKDKILFGLQDLFAEDVDNSGVTDNAAGAMGQMLMRLGGAVPLEEVVPALLAKLPLKDDTHEAGCLFGGIGRVLQDDCIGRVGQWVGGLVGAMVSGVMCDGIDVAVKQGIRGVLRGLNTRHGKEMDSIVKGLPEQMQQVVGSMLG